ncbi:hypothetical protein VOLCADRAFT_108356 [Volvox carteri f. nagariensis]|uniref:Protein BCCIP homolog n=1 Tax=Volvox carteri f. nagariensis TaxID=3068 RepID=D8UJN4_VOLCA|nr:uncharacterized protein VOLCADRAFT_108356 [Volvox carteri f. nagariensis]EFJ40052.1 hypothetical protein VOLCADRAFT_108356 [Volvox carteri f. nagariensis]|eukprot:XP_002958864.1 hypothetical protein VOLCADRAFT_108356 [Volvox carteri f. nagariensis]
MPKRKAEAQLKREKVEEEEQPEEQRKAAVDDEGDDAKDDDGKADDDSSDEGESNDDEDEDEDDSDDDDSDSDDDSCPDASASEAESDDDEEGEAYKEVNVQFEFFDPQERDFLGLKALLNTYLDGQQYDCSGLVDAIIRQTAVGTVVKSSEEDDPFAVLTAFNTSRGPAAGSSWLGQLRSYLRDHCPDEATRGKLDKARTDRRIQSRSGQTYMDWTAFQDRLDDGPLLCLSSSLGGGAATGAFSDAGTALLVSERLINCPPQLAPPLMQMLMEEIEGAARDEDYPAEEREEFAFRRYLHVTRVYTDTLEGGEAEEDGENGSAGGAGGSGGSNLNKSSFRGKKGNGGAAGKEQLVVYVRPEDEYLHQVCSWSFTFPLEGRPVAKGDLRPLRAVMCVSAERVGEARAMMDLVVGNMMAEGAEGGKRVDKAREKAGGKGL